MPVKFGKYPVGVGCSTPSEQYVDGQETGRNWPSHWNSLPGGPFVVRKGTFLQNDPEWQAYAECTRIGNLAWKKGFYSGLIANVVIDREVRAKLLKDGAFIDEFQFQEHMMFQQELPLKEKDRAQR